MDRLFFGINVGLGFLFYESFCQFIEILLRFYLFAAITQFSRATLGRERKYSFTPASFSKENLAHLLI